MHFGRLFVLVAAVGAATMFASIGAAALPREPAQPGGSPVAFLAHIVRLLAANRYAQAWTSLNPWQQSLASLPAYVACESQSPIPGQLVSLQVLRLRHESVEVRPDLPPLESTAVSFALRIAGAAVPDGLRIVLTAHAVAAGGRWTWILPPARLQLYRQGCGTRPGPTPPPVPTPTP